jgi:hypothetical protein
MCAEIEHDLVDVHTQQTSSVQLQMDHLQTRVKTSAIFCTSDGLLLECLLSHSVQQVIRVLSAYGTEAYTISKLL